LLSKAQQEDIAYVAKAFAECRPDWWEQSKTGKKFQFRPVIWGRTIASATFDPAGKPGSSMQTSGGKQSMTFSWKADELDSQESPNDHSMTGHGTKQGDMAEIGIWGTLSGAALMASIPIQTLGPIFQNPTDKEAFQRYELFQSQLAVVCHGSPRSRHAGMVIFFSGFMKKYGANPSATTRRAIGSMFLAELLADPAKWPSIRMPDSLPADNAEAVLGEHCIGQIDRNWTLAEDRALREAALAYNKANGRDAMRTGKIVLPNKLATMLDVEKDAKTKAERDAWVMSRFEKAKKSDADGHE
jgi:hypothetical protein